MRMLSFLVLCASLASCATVQPRPAPQTFHLVGQIGRDIVPYFTAWLASAVDPEVVIDTPGGSMTASMDIAGAIALKGNVTCVVRGLAASGGFGILQACAVRVLGPKATLMTHEPRALISGPVTRVDLEDLLGTARAITRQWNAYCRKRLRMTAGEYEKRVKGEDWVINPTEAVAIGAADRILSQ